MCGAGGGGNSGGGGGGGGGGGNDKPAKKAAPAPKKKVVKAVVKKKDNGTSKYFKKTSTPKTKKKATPKGGKNHVDTVSKPKAVVVKPTPKAPVKGSPHERNKDPVVKAKPKVVTTSLPSAKIVKTTIPKAKPKKTYTARENIHTEFLRNGLPPADSKKAEVVKPKAVVKKAEPANHPSSKKTAKLPKKVVNKDSNRSVLFDPTSRDKFINDKSKGTKEAKKAHKTELATNATKDRINLSKDNKTVAAVPKYDEAYWAKKRADGVSQPDMKAAMDKIGIKKAYSGDRVVTKANSDTAALKIKKVTGSMATIENGGVTKTEKKGGLLGEKLDTTYDYKGGPKIVTRATDPTIKGVRFGEKKSTTYVDGTEYATKTGHDPLGKDAKVTRPETAGHITDTVKIPTKTKATPAPAVGSNQGTASELAGGPAGTSIQPDNLKNILAVKKNKQRQGKRKLRGKRNDSVAFGNGGVGLNITT